jgi:hypothetical protein
MQVAQSQNITEHVTERVIFDRHPAFLSSVPDFCAQRASSAEIDARDSRGLPLMATRSGVDDVPGRTL